MVGEIWFVVDCVALMRITGYFPVGKKL